MPVHPVYPDCPQEGSAGSELSSHRRHLSHRWEVSWTRLSSVQVAGWPYLWHFPPHLSKGRILCKDPQAFPRCPTGAGWRRPLPCGVPAGSRQCRGPGHSTALGDLFPNSLRAASVSSEWDPACHQQCICSLQSCWVPACSLGSGLMAMKPAGDFFESSWSTKDRVSSVLESEWSAELRLAWAGQPGGAVSAKEQSKVEVAWKKRVLGYLKHKCV